jgi:dolichol kinase
MDHKQTSLLIRKLLHVSFLLPVAVYWWTAQTFSPQAGLYVLVGFLLAAFGYEFVRLETPLSTPLSQHIKTREQWYQVDGINLLLAITILHAVFAPVVAISASLVAILGDVVSTLGRLYGKVSIGPGTRQSWEGVVLAFSVDALILGMFFGPVWYIGMLAAVAVIIENILSFFDDNVVVPLVVGTLAEIMLLL